MLFKNFNSVIYNIKNGNKKSSYIHNIPAVKTKIQSNMIDDFNV